MNSHFRWRGRVTATTITGDRRPQVVRDLAALRDRSGVLVTNMLGGSHFPKTADREDFLVRVTDDHNDYRFRLSLTGFALLYQTTSLIVASINRSQPLTQTPITAVPGRGSLGRMEPAVRLTRR